MGISVVRRLGGVTLLAAVAGVVSVDGAAGQTATPCLKPGELFGISGQNYTGSTVDVRMYPEQVTRVGDQILLTTPDIPHEQAFPLGTYTLSDGAFSATVKLPDPPTFNKLPIIRGTMAGRALEGGVIQPLQVQYDVPSVTVVVYDEGGDALATTKPTISLEHGFTLEPYGWKKSKLYAHFVTSKGKKQISGPIGTSSTPSAFPCGTVLQSRALRLNNLKPGKYTLVVNTNKKKTTGGVRLKTKVTR